jgi:hypothetical protein
MQCYAGFENGRLILTKGFAESLTRAGFPPKPEIVARARAMDSAAAIVDDEPDETGALTAALNRAYERMLRGGNAASGPDIDENFAGVAPLSGAFERRAGATRVAATAVHADLVNDPVQETQRFAEFRAARGWDGSSEATLRKHFDLERAYAEWLHEPQSLSPSESKGDF